MVAIRRESYRTAARLIVPFSRNRQPYGRLMPLLCFAFAKWESVRVEEIKTQPDADVRNGRIVKGSFGLFYFKHFVLCPFHEWSSICREVESQEKV